MMSLELEKNGDSPTTCRINAERIKAGFHELETKVKSMEKTIEELSKVPQDIKEIKGFIEKCSCEEKQTSTKVGTYFTFVKDSFLVVALILAMGKMDPATVQKILIILSGS